MAAGIAEPGQHESKAWHKRKRRQMKRPQKAAFGIGAGEESRTPDLRITNALLYQLSYTGGSCRPAFPDCKRGRIIGADTGKEKAQAPDSASLQFIGIRDGEVLESPNHGIFLARICLSGTTKCKRTLSSNSFQINESAYC
jgi:hypothetical protein